MANFVLEIIAFTTYSYCTLGSLKDQLLYPSVEKNQTFTMDEPANSGQKIVARAHWLKQNLPDDDLVAILEKVDLLDVAKRAGDGDAKKGLQTVLDWSMLDVVLRIPILHQNNS